MTETAPIQRIEALIEGLIAETKEVFLVGVKIKPTNNIKVFLDADNGLSIEKCTKINRAMYRIMEEEGWYPDGNFSLEVSSPGVDEPLKLLRQFKKNIGRNVEVVLTDDTKTEGKLVGTSEEGVQIEITTGKNKKAIITVKAIAFADIKQVKVLISF